jgi:disulfide bond formation protein DsbB
MVSNEKDTPCRICTAIRIFLLSVLTIALLTFFDRSILSAVASFKPLTIAIILVGVLAFFALLKSAFEYRQWKKRD